MPKLTKQTITFDWTGQVTDKDDRKLQPGELIDLINTRRIVDGKLQKRVGYDKTSISSFSGSAYVGPAVDMVEDPGAIVWRDTADQIWALNGATGLYRGRHQRAFPTWYALEDRAIHGARKPTETLRTGQRWIFTLDHRSTTGTIKLQLSVVDATTRAVLLKTTAVSIAAAGVVSSAAVTDASNNVWFFYTDGTKVVRALKFTSVTATPAAETTYHTAADIFPTAIKARLLTSTGEIAVSYVGTVTGVPPGSMTFGHYVSYLDTATGLPKAGAVTATTTAPATYSVATSGLSIFGTGASTVFYLAYVRTSVAADDAVQVVLQAINTATLVATTTVLASRSVTAAANALGQTSGYLDGSGNRVVYFNVLDENPTATQTQNVVTEKASYDGVSTTVTTFKRSTYLASDVFAVGTGNYLLVGFDDGPATRAQRGYMLLDAVTGDILTTILDGEGAAMYLNGGQSGQFVLYGRDASHTATPVAISSTKVGLALLQEGQTQYSPLPTAVEIDFAAPYRSTARNVLPGGVPSIAGPQDEVRELAPKRYPYQAVSFTNGGGASVSVNRIQIVYQKVNNAGDVTESAPSAVVQTTFNDNGGGAGSVFTLSIPTNRHATGPEMIGIYGSVNAGTDLFLQRTVRNDPTVDAVAVDVTPASWDASGPLIYTTGDALDNAPVPPARIAVEHGGRLWLLGTPDGLIWFSQEKRPGRGYEFNEALVIDWPQRSGDDWWAAQVSPDVLAVGDGVSILLISGLGPDGLAIGAFTTQTVNTKKVPTNPRAVTNGPLGVYFQEGKGGRMCLLTAAGVTPIGQGAESFRSNTITSAVHVEGQDDSKGQVLFCAGMIDGVGVNSGNVVVLDADRPLPEQPAGQWARHSNVNLPPWVDMRVIVGAPVLMEDGTASIARFWQPGETFEDDGEPVLKDWTTGRYSPAGFLGEFDTDELWLSSTVLGGDSEYEITLTDDQGATETHTDAASATPDQYLRTSRFRTRDVRLRVRETSATGEGRSFDGVVMGMNSYGRPQFPYRRTA